MKEMFERLHADALHRADADLQHIAETEQLTAKQYSRITESAMRKAGLTAAKPIRHKKRSRLFGLLIAAVIAVFVLGAGASGWMLYNRQQAKQYFGEIGTAKLEELGLAGTQSSTNGRVRLDITAVLNDGKRILALLTFVPEDPDAKINWNLEAQSFCENGCEAGCYTAIVPHSTDRREMRDGTLRMTLEFDVSPEADQDSVTFTYIKAATGFPTEEEVREVKASGENPADLYETPDFVGLHDPYFDEMTEGLSFTLPVRQNVPMLMLTDSEGESLYMSGFEVYLDKALFWHAAPTEMSVTFEDGVQSLLHLNFTISAWHDENGKGGRSSSKLYEELPGVKFDRDDPATYNGYIDITKITSAEFDGKLYIPAEIQNP